MMQFCTCTLQPLTDKTANEISEWEYQKPYDVYNFKGKPNGYLFKKETWGTEQFCLMNRDIVVGQVACQFADGVLWAGWSLAPQFCGAEKGHLFVKKCVQEIRKKYNGDIFLKVAAWNKRAIKTYIKAGFVYSKTILDEIAYTNKMEDFWVMKYKTNTKPSLSAINQTSRR